MTGRAPSGERAAGRPWLVVAGQEMRDLWLAGRGLPLMLAFTLLLSATSYLEATNEELNFLEQREVVSLTLQTAVAVASLLVLVAAADSLTGERERATLESLLLTPAPRGAFVVGKALAALSLWVAGFALTVPYILYLGRGTGTVGVAVFGGAVVGGLMALALAGFGMFVSAVARSSRLSISVSLFVLLALFVPTQMPSSAQQGWFADLLLRVDPVTAGLRYLSGLVIDGHGLGRDVEWLAGPVVAAFLAPALALYTARRLSL